jgi:hypothetical protein
MAPFATGIAGRAGRTPLTQEQEAAHRTLLLSIYSNLGAAYLKLNDPEKAATYCNKVRE